MLIGVGIVGMTLWGNVEFWRHRRARRSSAGGSAMSAFSATIDDCESRPVTEPGGLEVRRKSTRFRGDRSST
jgi:hypothetical protein